MILAVFWACAFAAPAFGQAAGGCERVLVVEGVAGWRAEMGRLAELQGLAPQRSRLFQRAGRDEIGVCAGEDFPWFAATSEPRGNRLRPVQAGITLNSAYPMDRNNGALWAGRGVSTTISGGARGRWRMVTAQLEPALLYQQNRDFETARVRGSGLSPFGFPTHPGRIDLPQRFGDGALAEVNAGQSFLRADAYGVALGVSTESLWWGPTMENPILLSNTAPGFAHVFTGTSAPVATPLGRIEGEMFWARLKESPYFDADVGNDHRLFAGMVVGFQPRGVTGLSVGLARLYMRIIDDDLPVYQQFTAPFSAVFRNSGRDNELLGAFARWALPRSGFEVYGEWAREDQWLNSGDLLTEPGYSRAYALGLQKVAQLEGSRWLRVRAETIHLEGGRPDRSFRDTGTFYTHDKVVQGYTHSGQLLGSATGPGSGAYRFTADLFTRRGVIGVFGGRTQYNEDAYLNEVRQGRTGGEDARDIEYSAGARQLLRFGRVEANWSLSWNGRSNRDFIGIQDGGDLLHPETNWSVELGGRWWPQAGTSQPTALRD